MGSGPTTHSAPPLLPVSDGEKKGRYLVPHRYLWSPAALMTTESQLEGAAGPGCGIPGHVHPIILSCTRVPCLSVHTQPSCSATACFRQANPGASAPGQKEQPSLSTLVPGIAQVKNPYHKFYCPRNDRLNL